MIDDDANIEAVRPSATLPPIVERLPAGEEGEREFRALLKQLWKPHFVPQTVVLSFVPIGAEEGSEHPPIDKELRILANLEQGLNSEVLWSPRDIRLEPCRSQIVRAAGKASRLYISGHEGPVHTERIFWLPRDLSSDEAEWLDAVPKRDWVHLHIRGMSNIEKLLRPIPVLFARYYPELAADQLPGFVPFDFRAFAHAYCARIASEKQYVHLVGFPPDALRRQDANAHIRCAELFVPTLFRTQNEGATLPLVDLLVKQRSVLVLGDPGMGKTMLLTFLSLLHAHGAARLDNYTPPRQRIPFFISLREYALEDQTHTLSLLEYLAQRYARFSELRHAHPAFFEASLLMGEAIVLLDGLDEVGSSAARKRMADRIREMRREFPDCPIWVTSRIHGYTNDIALPADEFDHVRIGPLEDAQVDDFLTRWYTIQVPNDLDKQQEQKRSLREAIFRTKQVRALATNPLLLTLMAFVHRFLGHLPQDRGELYEQCVTMLLRNWIDARERPEKHAFERLGLAKELSRGYLEALAFHVQEQRTRETDEGDARGLFARDDALAFLTTLHCEHDRRDPKILPLQAREDMREFLDYACDRVGLLVDRGGGKLSFLHLSFQEYLAASFDTVMTNIREQERAFVDHACNPDWSEVLLLRLYLFARKRDRAGLVIFDELIRTLLDELGRSDNVTGWLLLGRALRDRHDVRQSQRRVVLERLVRVWSAEPVFDGDVFATLVDIRIFATDHVKAELRSACAQVQATGSSAESIAALYLEEKLFAGLDGAARRLANRPDLPALLPDLVAFHDVPEFAVAFDDQWTPNHWEAALEALDNDQAYCWTLQWATARTEPPTSVDAAHIAATRWIRRKVNAEVASRKAFAAKYHDHHNAPLFQRPGALRMSGEFRHVEIPLAYATVKPFDVSLPPEPTRLLQTNLMVFRWLADTTRQIYQVQRVHSQWLSRQIDHYLASLGAADGANSAVFSEVFWSGIVFKFVRSLEHWMAAPHQTAWESTFKIVASQQGLVISSGRNFATDVLTRHVALPLRGFLDNIGWELGADFSGQLMQRLNINPEHMQADLMHRALWKNHGPHEEITTHVSASSRLQSKIETKSVLPRMLADLCVLLGTNWILSLGRYLHVLYPDGHFPEEAWDEWRGRNPFWSVWSALAWNEHAQLFHDHHGKLDGPHGALMLAHADYAALMTGLDFENAEDYPAWKALVDKAGATQIEKLRHFASVPMADPSSTPILSPTPQPVIMAEPAPLFTFLHLSDMHFGLPAAGDRHNQSTILAALRDDFRGLAGRNFPRPDAIFMTGDIAWAGKATDYEAASKWLDEVLAIFGLAPDRVFVVPGNHDSDRSVTTDRMSKLLLNALRDGKENLDEVLEDESSRNVLLRRKEAYLEFAKRLAPACHAQDKPMLDHLVWTHREVARGGLGVHVIGLDTALLAAADDDAKKLRLGQMQIAKLNDCVPERDFVVVLGHHPFNREWLEPNEEREIAIQVRRRAHAYLTGHVHEHDSVHLLSGGGSDFVHIVAGALYGGRQAHIPQGHAYSLGAVMPAFGGKPVRLRIHPRRFSFKQGDFRADIENVPEGQTWAEFELPRLRR